MSKTLVLGPQNPNTGYLLPIPNPQGPRPAQCKITYTSYRYCFFHYDLHLCPRLNITPDSKKQE